MLNAICMNEFPYRNHCIMIIIQFFSSFYYDTIYAYVCYAMHSFFYMENHPQSTRLIMTQQPKILWLKHERNKKIIRIYKICV